MSKLLQRLSDASKSGLYRVASADAVEEAARGSPLRLWRVSFKGARDKAGLLSRLAAALQFPAWFGANWDALEDCLTDLSWAQGDGHVLLLEGAHELPADERGILRDVLASAAEYWAEQDRPFFALFVGGEAPLPALYRERR
jgi:hypothetical protein